MLLGGKGKGWGKPPRDVVDKIEKLLDSGKSDTAIVKHYTLCDYELSEQQVSPRDDSWEKQRYLQFSFDDALCT